MHKSAVLLFVLTSLVVLGGCAGEAPRGAYLRDYELAQPAGCSGNVYESADVRVEMEILDDRFYGLRISNKTESPMRVFWKNSTAVNADGEEARLGAVLVEGAGGEAGSGVVVIEPGGEVYARAFPEENVYARQDGTAGHYPLYFTGRIKRPASDIDGRLIGVRLVMGINDRTRLFPFMLRVSPSFFGI